MPRPVSEPLATPMSVRFPQRIIDKIDTTASMLYRTKTSIILEALEQYFARMPDKKITTLDD